MRTSPIRKGAMARQALDLLCSSLPDVAAELGVSIDTLRSYRTLRRAPSPETARALAAMMKQRAKSLTVMAAKLERGAKGGAR